MYPALGTKAIVNARDARAISPVVRVDAAVLDGVESKAPIDRGARWARHDERCPTMRTHRSLASGARSEEKTGACCREEN